MNTPEALAILDDIMPHSSAAIGDALSALMAAGYCVTCMSPPGRILTSCPDCVPSLDARIEAGDGESVEGERL